VFVHGQRVEQQRVQIERLAVDVVHLLEARVFRGVADQVHEAVVHPLDLAQAIHFDRVGLAFLEKRGVVADDARRVEQVVAHDVDEQVLSRLDS
jgi:hypothetical protein